MRKMNVSASLIKKVFNSPKLKIFFPLALALIFFAHVIAPGPLSATWGLVGKVFAWQQSQACPSCHMPVEDHYLNFAYFVESGDLTSTLVLNNNTLDSQDVRVNIFNSKGQLFSLPLSLPAQQVTRLNVRDLIKDVPGDFSSGNIQVFYHAIGMGVTGQVTVTSARQRYSFDSFPTETMMFASTRQDGILWLPDNRTQARVALTNTGSATFAATVSVGQKQHNIKLDPRETKVINLKEFVGESGNGPSATLLNLTHTGAPGELIATGYTFNNQNGFASNILFTDRATLTSTKLAGAHLRFGSAQAGEGFPTGTVFSAPLVVANISDASSEVRVSVDYTVEAVPRRVELAPFTLAAQGIKQLDLADEMARRGVTGPVENAGVDISYTGAAGAVIGRLTSVDRSGDYSFDVPIKDPLAGMNRVGGSYPWRLDQGYTTVLHLKNTMDKAVYALVQLRYNKGGTYNPERIKLAPFQTVAIDIRKLRDEQKPDIRKGRMSKEIASGKVVWAEQEIGSLIGRAEVFNVGIGVADSFSCGDVCTCPPVHDGAHMEPSSVGSVVGDSGNPFVPMQTQRDCIGNVYGPYNMSSSTTSWNSGDASVATVDSGGFVECIGVGSTQVVARFNAIVAYGAPGVPCFPREANVAAPGALEVGPSLQGINPQRRLIGTTGNVSLGGRGFGSNPTVNVSGGITASVQSASDTLITVNFDIVPSATPGNHAVTVTAGGRTSNSINFFVQVPTALQVLSANRSSGLPNGCTMSPPTIGTELNIRYRVLDQSNQPIASLMPLREDLTLLTIIGVQNPAFDVIGGNVTATGNTEASGEFTDNPIGVCGAPELLPPAVEGSQGTFRQRLYILVGSTTYDVRVNNFTFSFRRDCGNMSNGSDIQVNNCPP
jgi:hypothetical protein